MAGLDPNPFFQISELIRESKQHHNNPFGTSNRDQLSSNQAHTGRPYLVLLDTPLIGQTGPKSGDHISHNTDCPMLLYFISYHFLNEGISTRGTFQQAHAKRKEGK